MSGVQEVVFETVDIKGQWFAALQDLDPSVREALGEDLFISPDGAPQNLKNIVGPFDVFENTCFEGVLAQHLNATADGLGKTIRFGGNGIRLKRARTPNGAVS